MMPIYDDITGYHNPRPSPWRRSKEGAQSFIDRYNCRCDDEDCPAYEKKNIPVYNKVMGYWDFLCPEYTKSDEYSEDGPDATSE